MKKGDLKVKKKKVKTVSGNWKTQMGYYLMFIVPAAFVFIFNYVPMGGIWLAFIDYKPAKGIFGSKFIGMENFSRFFSSIDFVRVFRNTILYNVASIALVSIFCGILFALLLYEIKSRIGNKIFQTCMLLPSFLSWTVVSAALFMILSPDNGMLNSLLESLRMQPRSWYREQKYWPLIITIAKVYKGAGMASIYYFAALLSIDTELFDAANLDGANRIQQIRHISLPAISKIFCITLIMNMGNVLTSGVSPYYELTLDRSELYETTQVIGTYLYNGLGGGRYSFTTAVGLFESLVSTILVVGVNTIVKRVDPENAMF